MDKYIKYKQKYLNLKKMIGGFSLSSTKETYFLKTITDIVGKNKDYFDFNSDHTKKDGFGFDETLTFLIEDTEYNDMIRYLLGIYYSDEIYTEKITTSDGVHDKENVFKYHINVGALLFLNFMIELELFTLLHSIKELKFNSETHHDFNRIPTVFLHLSEVPQTRIYKDSMSLLCVDKITHFAKTLDNIFIEFMKNFITNIIEYIKSLIVSELEYDLMMRDVHTCIIPLDSFNHIYIDWKKRLVDYIFITSSQIENKINIKLKINIILSELIENTRQKTNIYLSEVGGLFSFMYLLHPDNPENKDKLFSSCITDTIFELYIMSRLHINSSILKNQRFFNIVGGKIKNHRFLILPVQLCIYY